MVATHPRRWYRSDDWGSGVEIEIGFGKTGRRAYGFDEVSVVPSRRTRDPDDVDISWEIDAFAFGLPMMAAAMDAAVSPATAVEIGKLGGLAVLNLEGLQTRYEDPDPVLDEIATVPDEKATRRLQEIYKEPVQEELVVRRIREIKDGGVAAAASLTPQRVRRYAHLVLEAELDILVVQGTVVSAEHDISQRMLTLKLRVMERDGLIERQVTSDVPPRTEYRLTTLGSQAYTHFTALVRWAEQASAAIRSARMAYDRQHPESAQLLSESVSSEGL